MLGQCNKDTLEPTLKVGDKVFLHDPVKKPGLSKKLSPKHTGPYEIIEQKGPVLYRLNGLPQGTSMPIHANRLRLDPPQRVDSLCNEEDHPDSSISALLEPKSSQKEANDLKPFTLDSTTSQIP